MSGLVLKLGPHERIMINGVVMENGDRRARLNVLTPEANVLRLRDAIHPDEVEHPRPAGLLHRPAGAGRRGRPGGGEPAAHPRHRAAEPGLPGLRQPRRISRLPPRRCGAALLPGDAGAARAPAARGAAARHRPASLRESAMSFQPIVPLAGIAGWRFLERTQASQQAAFEKGPELQRDIAYFQEKIGEVASAADLVADRRLLKVALGAFGLEERDRQEGLHPQDPGGRHHDPAALANRLTDKSWSKLTAAFGFGDGGGRADGGGGLRRDDRRRLQDPRLRGRGGRRRQQHAPGDALPARDRRARRGRGRQLVQRDRLQAAAAGDREGLRAAEAFGQIDIDQQRDVLMDKTSAMFGTDGLDCLPGSGGGGEGDRTAFSPAPRSRTARSATARPARR